MRDGSEAKVVVDHSTEIPKPGSVWTKIVSFYFYSPKLTVNLGNSRKRE